MRIALIHGNDGSDVRVGKTCRSLARLGFDTHFIGWDRRPGAAITVDLAGTVAHLIASKTSHGKGTLLGYLGFARHVVRTLHRIRPDVVCAVNEELAFLVLPFRGWLFDRLVCDIFDSLGPRAEGRPWTVRKAIGMVVFGAQRGADRLIATDETRKAMLGRFASKAIVIENVPEDPGDSLAGRLPDGSVKIFAAGSLDETRGIRQLLEAIEPLKDVRVVSAGWPYDSFASDVFVTHPRVEFHGIVTAARALELAASCDAVLCYYAPLNDYMVNASPNKVHDAMSVGRPVLINREVRLSAWVQEQHVGFVCDFADVEELRQVIASLGARRATLADFAARSRTLFLAGGHWAQMERRLGGMYSEFEDVARGG